MKTLILFSGGIDSTTLLWHLRAEGHQCECLGIDYGQRHRRELDAARDLAGLAGVPMHRVSLFLHEYLEAHPLFGGQLPEGEGLAQSPTVVPSRNLALIAVAAVVARARGCTAVAVGCQAGDAEVYPDCREEWLQRAEAAMEGLRLLRPFVLWRKAAVVTRARELGVPLDLTWSCYAGGKAPCGKCGACVARKAAGA